MEKITKKHLKSMMIKYLSIFSFLISHTAFSQNITGDYAPTESKCNIKLKIDTNNHYDITINNKKKYDGKVKISKEDGTTYLNFDIVSGIFDKDTIYIQNSGNSINPYWHFKECDEKYIHFVKQKLQSSFEKKLLSNYTQYDVILNYNNDFNNDGVQDKLYVLCSKKENSESLINNNSSISKRKLLIYFGTKNSLTKAFESDNIFPCRECLGKSDNYVSDLKFENNILNYTTTIAPFSSENYYVINFTLQFSNYNLSICKYKETYYKAGVDDEAFIMLNSKDIPKVNFNYYEWTSDKSWIDYVSISSKNLSMLNDFAYKLENINPSVGINILQKILQKFPNRVVAYLNLADSYWVIGNQDLAKENYKKYVELMKSQNKDLKKIPKEVLERIK